MEFRLGDRVRHWHPNLAHYRGTIVALPPPAVTRLWIRWDHGTYNLTGIHLPHDDEHELLIEPRWHTPRLVRPRIRGQRRPPTWMGYRIGDQVVSATRPHFLTGTVVRVAPGYGVVVDWHPLGVEPFHASSAAPSLRLVEPGLVRGVYIRRRDTAIGNPCVLQPVESFSGRIPL